MNHARRMWELLLPLGPYRRQGVYTAGELGAEGEALDGVGDALAELEREVMLDTAEGEGLEAYESLLAHRPVAGTPAARRAALSALLRIGGDSFTLAAINDNLRGCGINAAVSETGWGWWRSACLMCPASPRDLSSCGRSLRRSCPAICRWSMCTGTSPGG